MKEPIRFVCKPYLDAAGQFQWPAEEAERSKLASRLFGACLVGAMDDWINKALPTLQSKVSKDQWEDVEQVLFQTVGGVVFSILVRLDQFPCANLDLVLSDLETDSKLASITAGDIYDLHDRLWSWLAEFSEHSRWISAESG